MNEEQKTAVINIIECNNGPVPYILDGPPGTGKTRVLVAAIEEIVRHDKKKTSFWFAQTQTRPAMNCLEDCWMFYIITKY